MLSKQDIEALPLVLVVDDELDTSCAKGPQAGPAVDNLIRRWESRRVEYCRQFGLVPEDEETLDVPSPVARARFVAPLRWTSRTASLPSPEPPLSALTQAFFESGTAVSLVLLDIHVDYGEVQPDGSFDAYDADFGLRVLLPKIFSQFGADETGPGRSWTRCPVVIVSGLPKERVDEQARRAGARGMLSKHTDEAQGRRQLQSYLTAHGLLEDNRGLIFGRSFTLLNALAAARRAADNRSSVLLLGESGTGKELLARYTHDSSPRASAPYGVYHAAGRGDELQEDELFGHWAGAFTGAMRDQPGLLEELNKGTVFIDELGDTAPRVQNALMRPLQERQSARIGRSRGHARSVINLDVKFIFATNKDLDHAVEKGTFRPDLLQRISETTVRLPALRERRDDIPRLAIAILAQIDDDLEIGGSSACRHHFDKEALGYLQTLDFADGNVRELRSLILQVALANPGEPRLTETDFSHPSRLPRSGTETTFALTSQNEKSALTLRHIDALRRWVMVGPDSIPHGEMKQLFETMRGSAPLFLVSLLEIAVAATRVDGRPSSGRIVGQLWGRDPRSPQEARRALSRFLAVDWHGGSVASGATRIAGLEDLKIHELIANATKRRD